MARVRKIRIRTLHPGLSLRLMNLGVSCDGGPVFKKTAKCKATSARRLAPKICDVVVGGIGRGGVSPPALRVHDGDGARAGGLRALRAHGRRDSRLGTARARQGPRRAAWPSSGTALGTGWGVFPGQ